VNAQSNRGKDDSGEPNPSGVPPDVGQETPQTRALVRALENALRDFRSDITDVRTRAHTDFFRMLGVFALGFLALAGMVIEAYRWGHEDLGAAVTKLEARMDKIDDRGITTENTLSRIEQHLQDMQTAPKSK
jgi:hypothetical protein